MQTVEFGPWLPDQIDLQNPGLEDLENAIPGVSGYRPAKAVIGTGASVTGPIIGASSVYLRDGSVLAMCATTTDIYTIRGGSVTASSLSLSLATSDIVTFEQFNTQVYATTKNGATWVLSDIETDNTFAVSAGSPPSANAMAKVADFLVMGDLIDIDASNSPYRLRWSRFNNPQGAWTTDIGAQSGAIDLDAKYGPITAITADLVFQRQGVSRLTFTGSATVFDLDTFEENRGCIAPASAVQVGEQAYYLAHDGFCRTAGTTPEVISTGRIWDWFLAACNQTFIARVVGAVDYQKRCVVWIFPGGSDNTFTGQVWFNWETERWGYVNQSLDWVIEGTKDGVTLEQLAATYSNIDTMEISLDSPEFLASGRNLQVFAGGELGALTGGNLQATFTTGDAQPIAGERSFITEVHPLIEADNVNVRLGRKDRQTATFIDSATVAMGPIGFAPFNHDARYFRTTIEVPANEPWQNAKGFQINPVRSGST